MKKLKPRFKLWLNAGKAQGAFGDGKWKLLQSIQTEGTLQSASRKLQISYRKAWGDLKKAEILLKTKLVDKKRGGQSGGKTALTRKGKKWVKAYGQFRSEIEKTTEKAFEKYLKNLAK